jgi:lysylphosphatidylglycerol synthetase-like protein (DUF2156 family)
MPQFDFKKLRKTIVINRIIQGFFIILLVVAVIKVQAGLAEQGRPQRLMHAIVITALLQLALFYPLSKGAGKDAAREIESAETGLSVDRIQDLRRRRIFSEFMKAAIFLFFATFIARAPGDLFIQSTILFTFIVTVVTYLQCFNFQAKRKMSGE